jgi:hypothetical protein
MSRTGFDAANECPHLQPARPLGGRGLLIGIYCRLPNGRTYVPPSVDRRCFCLSGKWEHCPTYRKYAPSRET